MPNQRTWGQVLRWRAPLRKRLPLHFASAHLQIRFLQCKTEVFHLALQLRSKITLNSGARSCCRQTEVEVSGQQKLAPPNPGQDARRAVRGASGAIKLAHPAPIALDWGLIVLIIRSNPGATGSTSKHTSPSSHARARLSRYKLPEGLRLARRPSRSRRRDASWNCVCCTIGSLSSVDHFRAHQRRDGESCGEWTCH